MSLVYSTDPNFSPAPEDTQEVETLPNSRQKLTVYLDRRNRGGKQATIVKGFTGRKEDLEALAKVLKTSCGTGGSAKDGEIIIQGDCRDKIVKVLTDKGYAAKRGN